MPGASGAGFEDAIGNGNLRSESLELCIYDARINFILPLESNVWQSPNRSEDRFGINFDFELDGRKLWRNKLPGTLDINLWTRLRNCHWERGTLGRNFWSYVYITEREICN